MSRAVVVDVAKELERDDRPKVDLVGWEAIAHALGVCRATAIGWAKRHGLPVYRRGKGGPIGASLKELRAWYEHEHGGDTWARVDYDEQ